MSPKGRPAKDPEKKQSESVAVRFTPEEIPQMDWLVRQAEIAGGHAPFSLSLGGYIRSLMLKHAGWNGTGWSPKPETFTGNKTLPGFLALDPTAVPECEHGTPGCIGLGPEHWCLNPSTQRYNCINGCVGCIVNGPHTGCKVPKTLKRDTFEVNDRSFNEAVKEVMYGRNKPTDSQVLKAVYAFVSYRGSRLDAIVKPTPGSKVEAQCLRWIKAMIEKRPASWPTPEETVGHPCTNGTPECILMGIHNECNIGYMVGVDAEGRPDADAGKPHVTHRTTRMVKETRVCGQHTKGCIGEGVHDCRGVNYPVCQHGTLGCTSFGPVHECTYAYKCSNGTLGCPHGQQKQARFHSTHMCSAMLPNHGRGCMCDHCLEFSGAKLELKQVAKRTAKKADARKRAVNCAQGTLHCPGEVEGHNCYLALAGSRCVAGTLGCGFTGRSPHECQSCEHGTPGCTGKGEKHAC